ncbi:MAG: class I SAM-dependent methyltransferase [Planctomycetes bacterium]|nr:class I SAM-dependent methyltransferase [Planctomycetota bacterium]
MGLYSRFVFPCLCDFLMKQEFLTPYRRDTLAAARGEILEIGFGTGLNLPHYPPHVRHLTTIDANAGMQRKATARIARSQIKVETQVLDCERLPFPSERFDCVISTWTLCSIVQVEQALSEVYRVLKPGGQFLFLEHGLSPEPSIQKWQKRLNWLEKCLADGCHLDRNIAALVQQQPFSAIELAEFSLDLFPRTHCYMYRGAATK